MKSVNDRNAVGEVSALYFLSIYQTWIELHSGTLLQDISNPPPQSCEGRGRGCLRQYKYATLNK
jgi:hypothetical protein